MDYWAVFDNSGDLPSMIVSEESGKLKIVDDELFDLMVKNTGGKWQKRNCPTFLLE